MQQKRNAVLALLAEYEKAIHELQVTIKDITSADLIRIRDEMTTNLDCQSIQTILSHVISSSYSYCIYIHNLKDREAKRPDKKLRSSISEYKNDLDILIDFSKTTLAPIYDEQLEEFDNSNKIKTSWGQLYDIEQLMEHAIVHVLRHRRQIERFKKL